MVSLSFFELIALDGICPTNIFVSPLITTYVQSVSIQIAFNVNFSMIYH